MNLGLSSTLIVEKSSAILGRSFQHHYSTQRRHLKFLPAGPGYKNERIQYVNANHRDICKFESPDDPNYDTIKNALSSAVEDLLKDSEASRMLHEPTTGRANTEQFPSQRGENQESK